MTKVNNKIEKRLRKQISLYFYNSNHPELYTTDEIIRYEIEVDKIMGIFNQFIPILLQEQREEFIKIVEEAKLPYPNPYGRFVRVERVNNIILDGIIKILKEEK